jgi:TPR repeat protein
VSEEDEQRGRSLVSHMNDAAAGKSLASASTSDSASTIKAGKSVHSVAPTMSDLTAEEHVSKSIALHESGALQESTWHLRHAAKQGHPTGMLLYALACRHGWGMRPNPREAVQWLRKAADSASLEMADEEDQAKEGKAVDVTERKTRKAQFALSIYELGVSHMNGWGIEQDKALALRCFEIAACKLNPHSPTRFNLS